MAIVQAVVASVGWTFLAVVLLYAGFRLFDLLDPIDYQHEIRNGNIAAGIIVASIILSLAAIVVTVILT